LRIDELEYIRTGWKNYSRDFHGFRNGYDSLFCSTGPLSRKG
jgi:hypothetical protein